MARVADEAARGAPKVRPHFLGSVVLQQRQTGITDGPRREVIDGQQRLTTLQLLLKAAAAAMAADGAPPDAVRPLRRLLHNEDAPAADKVAAFKVWPTNVDQDRFRAVMLDDGVAKGSREYCIALSHFSMMVRAGPPRPATAGVSRPDTKDQTVATSKITDTTIDTTALPAAPAISVQGATRPARRPYDFDKLMRFSEAHGICQWPDPDGYPHHADVPGLTPRALGYDRCGYLVGVLNRHLLAATDGDGTYFVWRDPRTGERLGYRVYTRDAATAARVAQEVTRLMP